MLTTQQQQYIFFKILKKSHPDLHSSILTEVKKGDTVEKLERVAEIKQVFDEAGITERRLFIAVVIKVFHPALYAAENTEIPLRRGLNLQIAKALKIDIGNTFRFIQEVRTWLKYDIEDLRQRTDEFFNQNLSYGNEKN